jgi:regulator of PEP synthase PpsR (kinase-PPPase family)
VRTKKRVLQVVKEAAAVEGFIVHTIVSKKLRDYLLEAGRLHGVATIDLMGPLLAQLVHQLSDSPSEVPGLFHELNKAYFQRIDAMEYALSHDDGLRPEELCDAEIVLIGVSRTFKTPLSIYLAFKGWYVANVPIVLDFDPPTNLSDVPPKRVFALTTDPSHLATLRRVRHAYLQGTTGEYAKLDHVRRELAYANRIFNAHPDWHVIGVTNKPIEEIASEILNALRKSRKSKVCF